MKSRINVMKHKEKRQYNFKKYGYGSWKMESNRFHPSKIFLQAIDPTSPAPGDYNISKYIFYNLSLYKLCRQELLLIQITLLQDQK